MSYSADPSLSDLNQVELEAQGSLIQIKRISKVASRPSPAKRGIITDFSRASRRRLLKQLARIEAEEAIFITLTYPKYFPDATEAKRHLRSLLERFRRRFPDAAGIWRLEYQERGAPHFHLLMYNLPYIPQIDLQVWWSKIIHNYVSDQLPRVRIEMVRSKRGAMYYASKYMAKPTDDAPGSSFFIPVTYLHAGRFWGVFNRVHLPLAVRFIMRFCYKSERNFHNAKQIMRRIYPNFNKSRRTGGFCFHDNTSAFIFGFLQTLAS